MDLKGIMRMFPMAVCAISAFLMNTALRFETLWKAQESIPWRYSADINAYMVTGDPCAMRW